MQLGSQTARYHYDGQQRRIVREITHSGVLDATYHDYLREQSVIETRNGSDLVLQQWVWGLDYIDELVHVAVNADPLDDTEGTGTQSLCERHYVALHNANYNVLEIAIANAAALSAHSDGSDGYAGALGELVERYEYTPYGQRTCYLRPGSNDDLCQSPRPTSAAVGTTDLGRQPYGLNPLGHQGLWHDEAVAGGAEVYNRARHLHPGLGRFAQRDPLGYVGGMSFYELMLSNPINLLDPLGLKDYKIGSGPDPDINWDDGYAYNPDAKATASDYVNWAKYGVLLAGAEALGRLPDGTRAYNHYRDATGTDLLVDYNKAIGDDGGISSGFEAELAGAQADIEREHDGKMRHFSVYSTSARLVNSNTENWQKALGGHRIWGTGDVTYDPVSCEYTLEISVDMEDFYNFNKGQVDIATGLPDDQNGRFEVLGWAKSFYSRGEVTRTVTWKRGEATTTTEIDGQPRRRRRRR